YLQQVQANPGLDWLQRQTTSTSTADAAGQGLDAWMSARQIADDITQAMQDLQMEQGRLRELYRREEVFRPDWPTKFDPVDPDAPPPATPPGPASTMPAATQPGDAASPRGLYGDAPTAPPK